MNPYVDVTGGARRLLGPWTRVRLLRSGEITDLAVLSASFEGVTFVLPPSVAAAPRAGEMLHLLLDTKSGPLSAPVRADLLEVDMKDGRVTLICAFRKSDTLFVHVPVEIRERRNRRENFRVSPKSGEKISVAVAGEDVLIDGWLINVSGGGVNIASNSPVMQRLRPHQPVRVYLTIPGFHFAASADCTVSRTVHDAKPQTCALQFKHPTQHSEFERMIVSYVMRRQREIIQLLRGRWG